MEVGLCLLEKTEAEQAAAEGKLVIWQSEPIFCNLSWAYLKNRKDDPLIRAVTDEVLRLWDAQQDSAQ